MQEITSSTETSELEIEAPPGLMPDLSQWGIEEVERGVCEDTFENRRALKSNKASWNVVFDTNGNPTPYLQVISAEMYQAAQALQKSNLLTDSEDFNSDYLSGMRLLMAEDAQQLTPTWVLRTTRVFMRQQEDKRALGADAELYQSRLIDVPTRCSTLKADGTRCWGWSSGATESLGLCRVHARRAGKVNHVGMSALQIARNRLVSAATGATEGLEDLAANALSESVRLGAYNSILDRAGVRGGVEIEQKVEVTVNESAKIVQDRIAELRAGQAKKAALMAALQAGPAPIEDVVDAEVVEDE